MVQVLIDDQCRDQQELSPEPCLLADVRNLFVGEHGLDEAFRDTRVDVIANPFRPGSYSAHKLNHRGGTMIPREPPQDRDTERRENHCGEAGGGGLSVKLVTQPGVCFEVASEVGAQGCRLRPLPYFSAVCLRPFP